MTASLLRGLVAGAAFGAAGVVATAEDQWFALDIALFAVRENIAKKLTALF